MKLYAIKKRGFIYPQRFKTYEAARRALYGSVRVGTVVQIDPDFYGTPDYAKEVAHAEGL
jgi:hypothetical protein